MRFLVDTNVLLRWSYSDDPDHLLCRSAVKDLLDCGHSINSCAQVLIEYWVNATRPQTANGFGMDAVEAEENILDIQEGFPLLPEPPDIAERWLELVVSEGVLGKPAHDARLAALMLAHGISHILTLNPRDFERFSDITPVTPQSILDQR